MNSQSIMNGYVLLTPTAYLNWRMCLTLFKLNIIVINTYSQMSLWAKLPSHDGSNELNGTPIKYLNECIECKTWHYKV